MSILHKPLAINYTLDHRCTTRDVPQSQYVIYEYRAVIYNERGDVLETGEWFNDKDKATHDANHRCEEARWVYGFREQRPKYKPYFKPVEVSDNAEDFNWRNDL